MSFNPLTRFIWINLGPLHFVLLWTHGNSELQLNLVSFSFCNTGIFFIFWTVSAFKKSIFTLIFRSSNSINTDSSTSFWPPSERYLITVGLKLLAVDLIEQLQTLQLIKDQDNDTKRERRNQLQNQSYRKQDYFCFQTFLLIPFQIHWNEFYSSFWITFFSLCQRS